MILASIFAVSACSIQSQTSSARAAYGNAVPDFKANKKKNQKRKKKARREVKRKKTRNNRLYFHGRPY
jgi:hypothetical protein